MNDVTVTINNTLTIAPDVILKLQNAVDLIIDGALVVNGTATNPVYFTSYRDDSIAGDSNGDGSSYGARNDWHGIAFRDTSDDTISSISHAIIRFSGYDFGGSTRGGAIRLHEASPTIQYTAITNSAFCAISADLSSYPALNSNTFEENARNALCLLGGTLAADAIWNVTDAPYYLVNDVTVTIDNTLTIAPGVTLKLQNAVDLIVDGALLVNGTPTEPVYFTSYRDDSIAGDSNGDGSSYGAPNDWHGIAFRDTSDDISTISHAIIRFSGYDFGGSTRGGAIRLHEASPTIEFTVLTANRFAGISAENAIPQLICNNIVDNPNYGIFNGSVDTVVRAEGQWWGSESGPNHSSNPSGAGNRVSDGVDFIPWTTSPCIGTQPSLVHLFLPTVLR